jgi:hypothetical protein
MTASATRRHGRLRRRLDTDNSSGSDVAYDPYAAQLAVRTRCLDLAIPAQVVDIAATLAGELVALSNRQSGSVAGFAVVTGAGCVTVRVHDSAGMLSPARGDPPSRGSGWPVVQRLSHSYGYSSNGRRRVLWAQVGDRTPGAA